jgi:hypothetical protein
MTTTDERRPARSAANGVLAPGRARIAAGTLRKDRWRVPPMITFATLFAFVVYSTWAAFVNRDYFIEPYISPFYSPCITTDCQGDTFPKLFDGPDFISPAIYILVIPLGFRLTCYYYRKAYYRAFWLSPPACVVAEPHRRYTGETRFPLIMQNIHRYFFYIALILPVVLTYDAILAFHFEDGWGVGLGSIVLVVNAALLWLYSLSCHSCRHIMGGRLNHFSRHPMRYRAWTLVSRLTVRHAELAWVSLVFVALADLYVRLVAAEVITDPRWIP